MKGLKAAIKNKLPESWEKILRKHKILELYVNIVYLSLPNYMKGSGKYCGKYQWKIGLNRVEHMFKNWKIDECFMGQYKQIHPKKTIDWETIKTEVKNYEEACR